MTLSLAILASGNGTNAQAIFTAIQQKKLDATVRLLLCNRPGAGVIDRAKAFNIPYQVIDHKAYATREAHDQAMLRAIHSAGADTIALCGYMRMLTKAFFEAFPDRILNIHPALLPSFPGTHGIADAVSWGVKITGCTVHFVDEIMDHGSVIIQAAVPHLGGESEEELATRIHQQEHRIYPQALQWLAEGRLQRYDPPCAGGKSGRGVRLLPSQKAVKTEKNVLISPPLEDF